MAAETTPLSLTPAALPTDVPPRRRRRWRAGMMETLAGYGFAGPALLFFAVFAFLPIILGLLISFQNSTGFGASTWAGLTNYSHLLNDPLFWKSVKNTAIYTALTVPTSIIIGLGIALLFRSEMRGRAFYRGMVYFPTVISGVATAIVGQWMFNENIGVVDKFLRSIGLASIHWQSAGFPAMLSLVIMTLWTRVGFNMVIYLAGLQNVDDSYLETAMIEGANWWQRLWKVMWPLLGPTTFFLVVLNVIYSFQVFDLVFVMTGGGPTNDTNMMVTYAYQQGFQNQAQGYAAAIGMFLFVVVLVFTALQWRLSRNKDVAG
ncbi:MAG: carbohydrate ABC transporter permease [Acidimicrobiales bacterium]